MRRILTALALLLSPGLATAGPSILLKPDRVWTAENAGPPREGWAVLVKDGKVAGVGPAAQLDAAGADIVDLPGATLIPGLMDLHSHLFLHPYNETSWDDQVLKETPTYRTLRAAVQAKATRACFIFIKCLLKNEQGFECDCGRAVLRITAVLTLR